MKFQKRKDLDSETRLTIALQATLYGGKVWGIIKDMCSKYNISHQFVYDLKNELKSIFEVNTQISNKGIDIDREALILSMKLHGKSSLAGISNTLKSLDIPTNSTATISSFLTSIAKDIPSENPKIENSIMIIADEIFANSNPILVTMDAKSHYILLIELSETRSGEDWERQFNKLQNAGINISRAIKDQGSGLHKGAKDAGITELADLFHLQKPFDIPLSSLESKAIGSITNKDERLRVFNGSKSESSGSNKLEKYLNALAAEDLLIYQFDAYDYLHIELHKAFNSFDKDGVIRTKEIVKEDVETILSLMELEFSKHDKIQKAIKFLRKNISEYWLYYEELEKIILDYKDKIPYDILLETCLHWQKIKKSRAIKKYSSKKYFERQADEHLELACYAEEQIVIDEIYNLIEELENNVRSSSPLEAINSIIREYLNSSRGQVTQDMLNLIAYYINHKISSRGRYKGTSAHQRLTGEKTEDVIYKILSNTLRKSIVFDANNKSCLEKAV